MSQADAVEVVECVVPGMLVNKLADLLNDKVAKLTGADELLHLQPQLGTAVFPLLAVLLVYLCLETFNLGSDEGLLKHMGVVAERLGFGQLLIQVLEGKSQHRVLTADPLLLDLA